MITAFTIKNFKAIGNDPVRIELKPITLLFGANSAGKSSILHALNYAEVIFNAYGDNIDERTIGDDDRLNLGGFKRFIHGHDPNQNLVLRFDLDFAVDEIFDPYSNPEFGKFSDSRLHPTKLLSNATSAYVEVEVSLSSIKQHAYVSRYETGINGERIAAVYGDTIRYFNTAHPVFSNYWIEYGISLDHLVEESVRPEYYTRQSVVSEEENVQYNECETPQGRRKVFERLGRVPSTAFILAPDINNINLILDNSNLPRELSFCIPYMGIFDSFMTEAEEVGMTESTEFYIDDEGVPVHFCVPLTIDVPISSALDLQKLLRALLVEPGKLVGNWLNSMRYLGPLREIPPRNFIGRSTPRSWTKGLAAWDILYWLGQNSSGWWPARPPRSRWSSTRMAPTREETWEERKRMGMIGMIEIINDWLASDQRLNTGYKVVIERYREVSSDDPIFNFISGVNKPQDISELIKNYDRINRLPEKIRIRLEDKSCGLKLEPHEIGTGISQVLPVVVAAVSTDASLVAIEQPELHIHPALQVRLGDLFIENIEGISHDGDIKRKKSFLIETHSEHLILRLMRRIREGKIKPDDVNVIFVEPMEHGSRFIKLRLDEEGDFIDEWPGGFFEESFQEKFAGR